MPTAGPTWPHFTSRFKFLRWLLLTCGTPRHRRGVDFHPNTMAPFRGIRDYPQEAKLVKKAPNYSYYLYPTIVGYNYSWSLLVARVVQKLGSFPLAMIIAKGCSRGVWDSIHRPGTGSKFLCDGKSISTPYIFW